ncbi:DNA repair protein RecN [Aeromicrobium wangtongii]|uniref:DNA repair protein RecN n=1 Tax=Aeromicrobium wangtongii TaxID=2969247 RepID=A0ABY5MA87_9ACTN|nr:DNA repair protein RecN [Aeromicrobium wangtongii]MCD9198677.1 DNA repair protein RecN [Aeromicrobium wangtongii]MCL3818642.1 DNA repair protein RecN [Aeromicrobium wangtongii]UUP12701.1 DNA repair protein RecN [Aeromicrobium wangtongii]
MWQHLRLSSLGVIESAELELSEGFTVITGETGAGKTMVVTALGLLRGERADPGLVRRGADQARVEASIGVRPGAAAVSAVEEAGGRIDDDVVILGRILSAQGRSRAVAGGATVPAALLSEVTDELVAVHGQSDQHRLLRAAEQRAALDRFAGEEFAAAAAAYAPAYSRWRAVERTLDELRTHAQERARELDVLRFGLDEVAAVDPQPGEDEELKAEEGVLAHAESLAHAADDAHTVLVGDDMPGAARTLVAQASAVLQDVAGHDPALDALTERVQEVAILIDEVGAELAAYSSAVELDPERLATLQERRAALAALQRKYGPTLDDVLAWAQKSAARLGDLGNDDETIVALEAEQAELVPEVRRLAAQMSRLRSEAAGRLAELVDAELTQLSMPSAHLDVSVTTSDDAVPGPHGVDDVELLFAANSGTGLRPLHKGASGGELSRLMLALEVVLADRTTVPTLVFDEVDAGIGGKAAVEVGRRLSRLAEHAQVIAVTHLPQVAAFADHHFVVSKDDDGNVTSSSVSRVEEGGRVDELARMLAGQEESAAAQAHARELLELARGV